MENTLQLRDYQSRILDELRAGFADGKRTQILYAPTGGGKTEMAISLLEATRTKGNMAAMVLDRIILVDQTSQRLTRYEIDHGVLQAGHWRHRPWEKIQICSAQTLEKRGSFPGTSLLIIDEAHATRKATVEFIKNNPNVRVIGLTATPFTKGLGKVYEGVVSSVTTKQLVDQRVLVPLKVFIAREIDMTGAKKVAGEWSQSESEKRGMQITGDIVSEWIKKTYEVFGKPRKTIVFCSGVAHGADLAKKFAEQGYNFVAVSYRDDDQFKRDAIEDFARPDTEIHGLIATDILTKGFDVPDVMIGVSARPFSKSLSSHIQQMGRVMRGANGKEFALWLDHSGNYLRFQEDWDDVYENGVAQLDDTKEKPKREPTDNEKKESKCPVCKALWPRLSDVCSNCGHVRQRKNEVFSVPGELKEYVKTANKGSHTKEQFWAMCQWKMAFDKWSQGRAYAAYKNEFGVWPRGLSSQPISPDVAFEKKVRASLIRFLKGRK